MLQAVNRDLLPTDEEVWEYERRGWHKAPKIFSDDELDEAVRNVESFYQGHRDHTIDLPEKNVFNWTPGSGKPLRVNDFIDKQNDAIARIATNPTVGAIAGRLTRSDEIRLYVSSLSYKPPQVEGDTVKVGLHNDRAYLQMCTSMSMLTAWIALDDVDESMGPVTVFDESNQWAGDPRIEELRAEKTFVSDDMAGLEKRLHSSEQDLRPIPLSLRRGEVSFHHCLTFHGSGANLGDRPRIGLAVLLQDGANRHCRAWDPDGNQYVFGVDAMVRRTADGDPDYTDPEFCPVLWRAQTP